MHGWWCSLGLVAGRDLDIARVGRKPAILLARAHVARVVIFDLQGTRASNGSDNSCPQSVSKDTAFEVNDETLRINLSRETLD